MRQRSLGRNAGGFKNKVASTGCGQSGSLQEGLSEVPAVFARSVASDDTDDESRPLVPTPSHDHRPPACGPAGDCQSGVCGKQRRPKLSSERVPCTYAGQWNHWEGHFPRKAYAKLATRHIVARYLQALGRRQPINPDVCKDHRTHSCDNVRDKSPSQSPKAALGEGGGVGTHANGSASTTRITTKAYE